MEYLLAMLLILNGGLFAFVLYVITRLGAGGVRIRIGSTVTFETGPLPDIRSPEEHTPHAPVVPVAAEGGPRGGGTVAADPQGGERPAGSAGVGEESAQGALEGDVLFACRRLTEGGGLTPRESEVLSLLACGYNCRSIARKLVLSEATVKSHTYRIYRKLEVHSQQEVIERVHAG